MRLDELNALGAETAERELLQCCGSRRWAHAMAARRPWTNLEAMSEEADKIWRELDADDWLEAFAAHPRIGETDGSTGSGSGAPAGATRTAGGAAGASWSSQEQSAVTSAGGDVRARLAAANRAYEARFGFIFIVCATGRGAEEILASIEDRLAHGRDQELQIAAEEQRRITRLRLAKLASASR
jgi:OHCU decarboxylase